MTGATRTSRTGGLALTLWCVTAVMQLIVVGMLTVSSDEVADASPFGRSGTVGVAAVTVGIASVATVVAWRGASGPVRGFIATLTFLAVGVIALLAWGFLYSGESAMVLGILLAYATFALAMIGRAVLRAGLPRTER